MFNYSTPVRRSLRNRTRDLDKTHIICSLTPRQKNARFSDVFVAATSSENTVDTSTESKKPRRSARNRVKEKIVKPVETVQIATAVNPTVDSPAGSIASEDEDETIVSDTESDISLPKLRKTPNLRRLRRSFRDSLLAKSTTPTGKRLDSELASPMAEKQAASPLAVQPVAQTPSNEQEDEVQAPSDDLDTSQMLDSPEM